MNIIIATIHSWNIKNAHKFIREHKEYNIKLVTKKDELTTELLSDFNPEWILLTHWSWILPKEIYNNYKCVVFHVSDVPKARGGSPVQNQIVDGLRETKISAIHVDAGLDTGDVYCKERLSLEGSAEEIFIRSSKIVFEKMIPYIIENDPKPVKQEEGGFVYKRRKPEESRIPVSGDLCKVFDYIRMLDAEGYPKAYIEWGNYRMEFSRAKLEVDDVVADVKISLAKENCDNDMHQ